jgi:hypothetical protein
MNARIHYLRTTLPKARLRAYGSSRHYYIWYTQFMEIKTSYLIFLAVLLTIVAGILLKISSIGEQHYLSQISSYADCVAAGNPILESYPSQCKTPDGRTFTNPDEQAQQPAPTATQ